MSGSTPLIPVHDHFPTPGAQLQPTSLANGYSIILLPCHLHPPLLAFFRHSSATRSASSTCLGCRTEGAREGGVEGCGAAVRVVDQLASQGGAMCCVVRQKLE